MPRRRRRRKTPNLGGQKISKPDLKPFTLRCGRPPQSQGPRQSQSGQEPIPVGRRELSSEPPHTPAQKGAAPSQQGSWPCLHQEDLTQDLRS